MKILKLPFENKITCECGCEFEFDYSDLEIDERIFSFGNRNNIVRILYVECPFCKHKITIERREKEV